MDKRFWAVIGVIAVVFVGIVVVARRQAGAPAGGDSSAQASNNVKGDNAKNVTLVEYGDFQCPVCGLYEPTVKQVYDKYKTDITFQYRNFPLQQIHLNAFAGARAAAAAGLQGKFWEMHDQLYDNQTAWSAASDPLSLFSQYATTIGLNLSQFKTDFSSKKVNDTINADIREGTKLNVSGTPSFFLNGKEVKLNDLVDGATQQPSADKFGKLIDAAIKAKASGVSGSGAKAGS